MSYEFKIVRRVDFAETDMAGIVHFSNFFRYMESAETAFFRSLGFSLAARAVELAVGWPRVHVECDYKQPLRFEDEVEIHLLVSRKKSKALSYAFVFRKLNASPPAIVARGALTAVCVTHRNGKMKAVRIPKMISDKIQVAPAAVLKRLQREK